MGHPRALDAEQPRARGDAARRRGAVRADLASPAVAPFERMWHDTAVAAAREALEEACSLPPGRRGRDLDLEGAITAGLDTLGRDTAEAGTT